MVENISLPTQRSSTNEECGTYALQLIGSLFGKDQEVVDLVLDYLAMLKIYVPGKKELVASIVQEMGNVRDMSSRFSLMSFKVWLKKIFNSKYQLLLEEVVKHVSAFI